MADQENRRRSQRLAASETTGPLLTTLESIEAAVESLRRRAGQASDNPEVIDDLQHWAEAALGNLRAGLVEPDPDPEEHQFIRATLTSGDTVGWTEEEITEMLADRETYRNADNLPRWLERAFMRNNNGEVARSGAWSAIQAWRDAGTDVHLTFTERYPGQASPYLNVRVSE